nr:hypothetical protein [Candidatus Baldrarchaeota archaeon]
MPSKCPERECNLIYEITLLEENKKEASFEGIKRILREGTEI